MKRVSSYTHCVSHKYFKGVFTKDAQSSKKLYKGLQRTVWLQTGFISVIDSVAVSVAWLFLCDASCVNRVGA